MCAYLRCMRTFDLRFGNLKGSTTAPPIGELSVALGLWFIDLVLYV